MRWKSRFCVLGAAAALHACGDFDTVIVYGTGSPSTTINPVEGTESGGAGGGDGMPVSRVREGDPPLRGLDPGSECHVTEITPTFGATAVPVTAAAQISFSHDVDAARVQDAIRWFALESEEAVDFEVTQVTSNTLALAPRHQLGFWQSYALVVDRVESNTGLDCDGLELAFATVAPQFLTPPVSIAPALSIARAGNVVYSTAPSLQGVQVHVLGAEGLGLRSELHLGVATFGIFVSGQRAYVPNGPDGVAILDISVPEAPQVLARIAVPGDALDVVAFQRAGREVIAIAAGRDGVILMDVTRPDYPSLLSSVDMSGVRENSTIDVDVQGQWLAVADGRKGLHVIDVSDPVNPFVVGSNATTSVQQVELAGDRLYALYAGWPRVWSYDVANPATAVAKWNSCGVPCGLLTMAFDVQGDTVFVATSQGGVHQLAVQEDDSLVPREQVLETGSAAMSVFASGDGTLVGGIDGLAMFSTGADSPMAAELGHGDAQDVAVRGDYAYVAASFAGLQTFDISEPENPRWTSRVDSPGVHAAHDRAASSVAVYDDVLILADGRSGVSFYSLEDPARPRLLASFLDNFDHTGAIEIVEATAYVCNDNGGVEVIDMSRPEVPVRLEPIRFLSTEGRSCRSVRAHPNEPILYVGTNLGLVVYDLGNANHPVHIGDYLPPPGASVTGIAIEGERLFLSTTSREVIGLAGGSRLQVASLQDPRAPVPVWQSEPLSVGPISVVGKTLLMSTGTSLEFFDISKEAPRPQGAVTSNSAIHGFTATGAAIYLAQSAGGLAAIHTGPLPID